MFTHQYQMMMGEELGKEWEEGIEVPFKDVEVCRGIVDSRESCVAEIDLDSRRRVLGMVGEVGGLDVWETGQGCGKDEEGGEEEHYDGCKLEHGPVLG
jgi:hypothetical protein